MELVKVQKRFFDKCKEKELILKLEHKTDRKVVNDLVNDLVK